MVFWEGGVKRVPRDPLGRYCPPLQSHRRQRNPSLPPSLGEFGPSP